MLKFVLFATLFLFVTLVTACVLANASNRLYVGQNYSLTDSSDNSLQVLRSPFYGQP